LIADRTLVFANPTTDAEIRVHIRALQHFFRSVAKLHLVSLEPDRLRRCGADLFAYYTIDIHRPREASSPVIKGSADLERLLSGTFSKFFVNGERADRSGRAYATAEHTVVLAVTDPADQDRCPDPLESCLQ